MRYHKITCAALITSLAWLGGSRAEHEPTPEDWAISRCEALLAKTSHYPSSLRAVMSPERAADPDMKIWSGWCSMSAPAQTKTCPEWRIFRALT